MLNVISGIHGGGAAPDLGAYEAISTVYGNGSSGTILFTNIPSTYKHLQIRAAYQCSTTDNPYMRVGNGSIDSGGNYSWHHLWGDGGGSAYSNANGGSSFVYFGYSQNSTYLNLGIIDILDYASSNKNKTIRILSGQDNNGSGDIALWSGSWANSSAAINQLQFTTGGTFSANSSFALYGIKG